VPHKHPSGRQQYDVDLLNLVAEECGEEEMVYYASHTPLGMGMRLQCDNYDVDRLSGIA
jgi:hypothetical protein